MEPLSLASRLRICDDVVFQNLQGELVLLHLKTNVYCGLDSIGTRIWQFLEEGKSLGEVVQLLLDEYEVAESQLTQDLLNLTRTLQEKELVQPLKS